MADTPIDPPVNPEVAHALQSVVQNLLGPVIGNLTKSAIKRTQPLDPQDTENQESGDADATARSYQAFGRIFARQASPFTSIDNIVNFGIKHEVADDVDSDKEAPILSEQDRRLLYGWTMLCTVIPGFRTDMLALSNQRKVRKATCQQIHDGVTAVGSDDRSSLKTAIPLYLLLDNKAILSPSIAPKSMHKNDRGFYHPVTTSLLSPIKYPDTPETHAALHNKWLPVTALLLPRFLFPEGHIYNPEDISCDVLRGHVMIRTAKHIFQGPTTAFEEPGAHRGKQGNAALSGLTSMTPHTIAYVTVQARFAMSSTSSWTATEGTFSYEDFYWRIISLFDDDEDSKDLLQFFNHHVFSTTPANIGGAPSMTPIPIEEDDYEMIKRQRAAKRARLSGRNNPSRSPSPISLPQFPTAT